MVMVAAACVGTGTMSPVGFDSTNNFWLSRQASAAASQQTRRAEQAEREASELLRESRSARAQANRLQATADEREAQAAGKQDEAQTARRSAVAGNTQLKLDRMPAENPLPVRETGPTTPGNGYRIAPERGSLLDVSA